MTDAAAISIEPWWDLFVPALFGDRVPATHALVRASAEAPSDGAVAAIAARAWAVLGDVRSAEKCAARAFWLGGEEADALAVLVRPDGPEVATRRLARAVSAGSYADAACDAAARALCDGRTRNARESIALAVDACPDHTEASRWGRFLAEDPEPARRYAEACSSVSAPSDPNGDLAALAAPRARGWMSRVRVERRLLLAPMAPPPKVSSLGRLTEAGVGRFRFALEQDHARRPPNDPLADLEVAADLLTCLVEERREAGPVARALWNAAWWVGLGPGHDAARILVAEASRDDRLAVWGRLAAGTLAANGVVPVSRWRACEALFARLVAPDRALATARALVASTDTAPEAYGIALDTLRLVGHHAEARQLAEQERSLERLGVAAEFLERPGSAPGPVLGGWSLGGS